MRRLLVALGATFVVLLGTGVDQAFRYRPSSDAGVVYDATELLHRIGAFVFAALVFVIVVMWVSRSRGTTRTALITVVVLAVLALATVAEIITGRGIRWSQLALPSEHARVGLRGVVGLDHVEFVRLGTTELAWSEFSSRVFLHLVVFPIGLVLCAGVLWFLSVRDDRRRAGLAGSARTSDGNDVTDVGPT